MNMCLCDRPWYYQSQHENKATITFIRIARGSIRNCAALRKEKVYLHFCIVEPLKKSIASEMLNF